MQKEYGLKSIHEIYFNSLFIKNNYFIFPGGKLIIILILLSLSLKILTEKKITLGTFIIHIGIVIFILFAFLFLNPHEEKYIIIKENETSNKILNNNSYDINFTLNEIKNLKINSNKIKNIKNLNYENLRIEIKKHFKNVNVKLNNNLEKDFFSFKNIKYFVENEHNKAAFEIIFKNNTDNKIIKKIYLIEGLKEEINIKIKNIKIDIKLVKSTEVLPFNIYLKNFKKINYNNTNIAKSFESNIIIKDKNVEWKYKIKMNKPLKYKNYIFYQSSYIEDKENSTILYVTYNSKTNYIYLACFIILIGFISHLTSKNWMKNND